MDPRLHEQERISLRQELHNLKACQITFLTTSVTATGLLLGLATTLMAKVELDRFTRGLIFVLPLIVLLPFWWVFFDKATSITRIVGYYRILEKLNLNRCKVSNFVGWENAIGQFRSKQEHGQFQRPPKHPSWYFGLTNILILRTGHKYWIISYYIFFCLSAVCTVASIGLLRRWYLITPLAVVFIFSAAWNIVTVWQLVYGHHSYNTNEHYWKQILKVEPLRHENQPELVNHDSDAA